MNKNIFKYAITFLLTLGFINTYSQTFEIRTTENDYGYLAVQMRETSGTGTPTTSTNIVDITFVVRYPSGAVDFDLICSTNDYYIIDGLGGEQSSGGFDYHYWNASNTPYSCPNNWVQNTWVDIAVLKATGATGSGTVEIAPNNWDGRSLNWNQGGIDYLPIVNGNVSYSYPTVVYDLVWKGGGQVGFETDWFFSLNWEDECGDAASSAPNSTLNVYIPDVSGGSGYLPSSNLMNSMACKNLRIEAGGQLSVPATNGALAVSEKLYSYGTLTITPNANATITGDSYLDAAQSIVIQATSSGVGSFIDNGTITYGASGTAKVQTYLSNNAGNNFLDIHLVGPTVDKISGGTDGALLSAFNLVNGNTYAYEWDETEPTVTGWQNIFDNSYVVNAGAGIGLSTDDGNPQTIELTGELMTGPISSPNLTYSNNHNELISNPYPSAIDFDGLAGIDNSSVVENMYWIWNPVSNTYVTRAAGVLGSQYIQVGQGFFVRTKSGGGTFDFTNARRAHSNDAFRDIIPNLLTIKAYGGQEGYEDEMAVRFDDNATSGYDNEIESEKWSSQNSDATQISCIAEDNTELAINVLPLESLNSGITSVPMHFNCGYNAEYTLSFYDLETFEVGSEIWLEDKLLGGDWISVNNNPDYVFTATPDDAEDRFVIHFFGPTDISEYGIDDIDIYSYRQHALVKNNTGEHIKNISIYTLSGELLVSADKAELQLNKFWVSDELGYFVVRVITDSKVYTEKVFISK